MSLIRRSNVFDPFSLDLFDPFDGFPFGSGSSSSGGGSLFPSFPRTSSETAAFAGAGERNKEQEEKTDTWHRVERSSGRFLRRFRLPENAKPEQIKASMENGVLTVTVPKEEAKKSEVKSIQISG
ncbi:hypothetical protein ACQ4PT_026193 [Festuca glaucescens]